MKTIITLALITLAGMAAAEELVFSNQVITVDPSQLSVESVEYDAGGIETNTVYSWVDTVSYSTNEYHNPPLIFTNNVQQQVSSEQITTNAPHWTVNVMFELPRGHRWNLNQYPVAVERFRVRLEVVCSEASVQAVFGSHYDGLLFAAQTGVYQPSGDIRSGFLGIAAGVLAGGDQ